METKKTQLSHQKMIASLKGQEKKDTNTETQAMKTQERTTQESINIWQKKLAKSVLNQLDVNDLERRDRWRLYEGNKLENRTRKHRSPTEHIQDSKGYDVERWIDWKWHLGVDILCRFYVRELTMNRANDIQLLNTIYLNTSGSLKTWHTKRMHTDHALYAVSLKIHSHKEIMDIFDEESSFLLWGKSHLL